MNIFKNDMPFLIDLVAGIAKYGSPAGSSEEVAAAVAIDSRRRMKKMTGDASQPAVHQRHISWNRNICRYINGVRLGLFQIGMTAHTFGIEHGFKEAGIFFRIHMASVAFFA
jgi:hypothetical protein